MLNLEQLEQNPAELLGAQRARTEESMHKAFHYSSSYIFS